MGLSRSGLARRRFEDPLAIGEKNIEELLSTGDVAADCFPGNNDDMDDLPGDEDGPSSARGGGGAGSSSEASDKGGRLMDPTMTIRPLLCTHSR